MASFAPTRLVILGCVFTFVFETRCVASGTPCVSGCMCSLNMLVSPGPLLSIYRQSLTISGLLHPPSSSQALLSCLPFPFCFVCCHERLSSLLVPNLLFFLHKEYFSNRKRLWTEIESPSESPLWDPFKILIMLQKVHAISLE